ncbi:FAD/NAD(P)-binding protein [Saccharopolyspora shandongensis]|uniref:FAD/NAD(P)-binding protein n=1 Tax=Saccharopolyspora shandongensis TaxID=418495 RepID=UPI00340BC59B
MSRPIEIGVVGGGASAVCLLDALAQADSVPGSVTIFEPSEELWRGRPFQSDVDVIRVNAPPEEMSVRFGDTAHFERWLVARDLMTGSDADELDSLSGIRFVPRARFGEYLEQSAHAALLRLLERGWRLDLIRERVDSAVPAGNGVTLTTSAGTHVAVDSAVLCVGGGRPADTYSLAGAPGYLPDPYPVSRNLAAIDSDSDVDVIGSGLTGVDVVVALAACGHRGRIRLLSRSGILPCVRQRTAHYTLRQFTPERFRATASRAETITLAELIGIMREELIGAGEDLSSILAEITALERESPGERLRRNIAEIDSSSLALRILQRAVPDTGPDVWPLLPEWEKDDLLRLHYRTMMSLCCPMPPCSATTLLALIDSGQLEVVSGISSIEALASGGFAVAAADGRHRADVVVNGVNVPTHKISAEAEPLVTSLVAAGVAERHPRGGTRVERATSQLMAGGLANPRLYALGDLAAGSLFFTFGIPSLVDRAYDIVSALLNNASTGSPRADAALQTV